MAPVFCSRRPASAGAPARNDRESLKLLTDQGLIAAFKTGCDGAFDVLYARYREKVLVYLRGMLHNAALAEEIYNIAMFRVYSRLPHLPDDCRFRSYLYRAVHNCALRTIQRESSLARSRRDVRSLGDMLASSQQPASPEESLANHQCVSLIGSALADLPVGQRAALLLFHNDGLSYLEIAEVLGKPLGTIRWMLHTARASVAEQITGQTMLPPASFRPSERPKVQPFRGEAPSFQ